MRIGSLRHRVDLEQEAGDLDANGERVKLWKPVAKNLPAKIEGQSGQELLLANQAQAIGTHLVTIRFRDDVTPQMRFKWGNRYLYIASSNDPEGRRRKLEVVCSEDQ